MAQRTGEDRELLVLPVESGKAEHRASRAGPIEGYSREVDKGADEAWERGREAWPEIDLARSDFDTIFTSRAESSSPPTDVSEERAADFYLAAGCAAGDAAAIAAFYRELGPVIAKLAARALAPGISADDVSQSVLSRLLVGTDDVEPKIKLYRGLGSLKSWVRSVAARAVINLNKSAAATRVEVPIEEALFDQFASCEDLELEFLKERYRAEFKAAFGEAVAELAPRDRNYLRHLFIDRLTIDQVAAIYAVHRSTAARRLAGARDALLVKTRASLGRRLGASAGEVESIVNLIGSRWELSISRIFGDLG